MRGFIVLAGMIVAATAAGLVWLDATGQLRPWLTTTPEVVFQLAPVPVAAAETGATPAATLAAEPETDAPARADDAFEPAGTGPGAAADQETTDETDVAADAATAADGEDAATAETELAADFGEGAVALSDVPIATGDVAADSETAGDGEPIAAEPSADDAAQSAADAGSAPTLATQPDTATGDEAETAPAAADTAATTTAEVADEAMADTTAAAEITETVAEAAPDSDTATPEPKPEIAAVDPAAVQTAALPTLPYDPNLPWRLYAAPFSDGEPRPRIAIVFVSLGLSDGATEAIIQQLPGAVTLAFSPYSRKLPDWISRARANGHEVLVELPMEPLNYPDDDPGPLALLDDRPMEDNVTRLGGILDRAQGAVGVAAQMGSRFSGSEELMRPILAALGERGYLYVDNSTAPMSVVPALSQHIAVPVVINDHYLDTEASRIAIDGRLQQIERIARSEGAAVAFAMPYPITIERLLAWIPTLEAKGFVLAPVTAVVGHQELP